MMFKLTILSIALAVCLATPVDQKTEMPDKPMPEVPEPSKEQPLENKPAPHKEETPLAPVPAGSGSAGGSAEKQDGITKLEAAPEESDLKPEASFWGWGYRPYTTVRVVRPRYLTYSVPATTVVEAPYYPGDAYSYEWRHDTRWKYWSAYWG